MEILEVMLLEDLYEWWRMRGVVFTFKAGYDVELQVRPSLDTTQHEGVLSQAWQKSMRCCVCRDLRSFRAAGGRDGERVTAIDS